MLDVKTVDASEMAVTKQAADKGYDATFTLESEIAGLKATADESGKKQDTLYRDAKTPRLFLRVSGRTGRKRFVYVFRRLHSRIPTKQALSPCWPKLSLKEARKQVGALSVDLDRGVTRLAPVTSDMTISTLTERYKAAKPRRDETIRIIDYHIVSKFGKRGASTIKTYEITEWHRGFTKTVKRREKGRIIKVTEPAPHSADMALDLFKALLNFGMKQELIPFGRNPCTGVERNFTPQDTERHHDWTEEEVKLLGAKLADMEAKAMAVPAGSVVNVRDARGRIVAHHPSLWTVYAFHFLLLTGVRKMQALNLEWAFVKENECWIEWPKPNRTKKRKPARPITPALSALIQRLKALRLSDCPYVFVGADRKSPLTEIDSVWDRIRHEFGFYRDTPDGRKWARVHDLRHLYGDEAGDAKMNEKEIGDLLGNTLARRYSKARKRKLLSDATVVSDSIARKLKMT